MKDLLIAIVVLAIVVALFSYFGEIDLPEKNRNNGNVHIYVGDDTSGEIPTSGSNPVVKPGSDVESPRNNYNDIVERIIRGEFGNQWDNGDCDYRKKLVEAEGYDYEIVQNLVNERLG